MTAIGLIFIALIGAWLVMACISAFLLIGRQSNMDKNRRVSVDWELSDKIKEQLAEIDKHIIRG